MGQKGAPRRPAARCFRAQRDGCRGLDSVVPAGLLRQRRLAPIGAGALHAPRRQVEPGGLEQLHTERVHEGARVLPATASISQAPARPSPGSAPNAACDLRAERRPAPAGADLRLGP